MTSSKITPFLEGDAAETSEKEFRKQVLPVGEYDYKGRKLNFTKEALQSMADSFNDKAFDSVPLQLATDQNSHNEAPERTAGQVKSFELADDGLYANFSVNEKGAEVLKNNPNLGVSAMIQEDYDRSDGKHYDLAIRHVLGTVNPKIPGLSPWSAVELSEDMSGDNVVDLSRIEYSDMEDPTKKGETMPKTVAEQLTEEEIGKLRALVADSDTTTEDLIKEIAGEVGQNKESETDQKVKLSNDKAEQASAKVYEMANKLAKSEFDREADSLVRQGVPPRMIELSRPVMETTDEVSTIALSNGESLNPRDVLRSVLNEAKGTIDLSNEKGHEENNASGEDAEYEKFRDAFFADMG